MKHKLIIALIMALLMSHEVYSDDAPLRLVGGGVTPTLGSNDDVRMESEEVIIKLNKKSYTVDATFNFFNTGETGEENVGFPKRGVGYFGDFKGTKPFIRFETWVNSKKVQFTEEPDTATVEGGVYLPDLIKAIKENKAESLFVKDFRWVVKRVSFPGHKKTVTRVRYEAEYEQSSNCLNASYIYGTGTHWKDTIGSAVFRIDSSTAPDNPIEVRFPVKKKYSVSERQISTKIREYQAKKFKPQADDELFIFIGPCP